MRYLGFSGHAPVPFENDWLMPQESLAGYLREIRRLREGYESRISILLGLEVDYLPPIITPTAPHITALGLDYTIGSIHFLGRYPDGTHWSVDHNHAETLKGIRSSFDGDVRAAVCEYYRRICNMVSSACPDVVGHLDIVKKYNISPTGDSLFAESAEWYRRAVFEALDAVAESGAVMEVNTGALARGITAEAYPSQWVVDACHFREIPLMINADAHDPSQLTACHDIAAAMLARAGYAQCMILTPEGWETSPLGER